MVQVLKREFCRRSIMESNRLHGIRGDLVKINVVLTIILLVFIQILYIVSIQIMYIINLGLLDDIYFNLRIFKFRQQ